MNVAELLDAPCVFCGYNGPQYYQEGTHKPTCPWHHVGGGAEREAALPTILRVMHETLVKDEGW